MVNPYLAVMVLLYLCLVFLTCWYASFRYYLRDFATIGDWRIIVKMEDFKEFVFMTALVLANAMIIYHFSEQYFGVVSIKDDCIIMFTPFKRRRKILFVEIQCIGIDIGTTGAFWIYINRTPIPMKYHNKINKIPLRKVDILFAYSDRAYESLCKCLPKHLSKQFASTASILRLYNSKS